MLCGVVVVLAAVSGVGACSGAPEFWYSGGCGCGIAVSGVRCLLVALSGWWSDSAEVVVLVGRRA